MRLLENLCTFCEVSTYVCCKVYISQQCRKWSTKKKKILDMFETFVAIIKLKKNQALLPRVVQKEESIMCVK